MQRHREGQIERQLPFTDLFPKCLHSWDWTKPKPEVQGFLWSRPWAVVSRVAESLCAACQAVQDQKVRIRSELGQLLR